MNRPMWWLKNSRAILLAAVLAIFTDTLLLAQDTIGIAGNLRTGGAGTSITVPVFLRDVIGTPAGRDMPVPQQISNLNFRVTFSDDTKIAGCLAAPDNCTFVESGILSGVPAAFVANPCETMTATGCTFRAISKSQPPTGTVNSLTYTLHTQTPRATTAAVAPGDLIGYLTVKLAANFAGTLTVNLDPNAGFLGGSDTVAAPGASTETALNATPPGNGQLALSNTVTQIAILDVDNTGDVDPFSDGILIIRRMLGSSGAALTAGAVPAGAARSTAADLQGYIDSLQTTIDIDGNGAIDPFSDGILIIRYMLGVRGAGLINGVVGPGATRTTAAQIEAYLATLQ